MASQADLKKLVIASEIVCRPALQDLVRAVNWSTMVLVKLGPVESDFDSARAELYGFCWVRAIEGAYALIGGGELYYEEELCVERKLV